MSKAKDRVEAIVGKQNKCTQKHSVQRTTKQCSYNHPDYAMHQAEHKTTVKAYLCHLSTKHTSVKSVTTRHKTSPPPAKVWLYIGP